MPVRGRVRCLMAPRFRFTVLFVFMMLIAWESPYLSPDEELLKAALMSRVLVAVSSSTDLDAAVLLVGETRI